VVGGLEAGAPGGANPVAEGFQVGLREEEVEGLRLVDPLLAAGDAGEFRVPVKFSFGFCPVLCHLGAGGFGSERFERLGGQCLIERHEGWGGWDDAHGLWFL